LHGSILFPPDEEKEVTIGGEQVKEEGSKLQVVLRTSRSG
jgi:hypothetical protein